jgi:pantoate--beta-alanine ligase
VLRRLVRDLGFPAELRECPIVREADGLAMSSRNGYLSADERKEAVRLSRNLKRVKERVERGEVDIAAIEGEAAADLAAAQWVVDYVAVRRRSDLAPPSPGDRELVVLGAASLGKTRLIDNLEIGA